MKRSHDYLLAVLVLAFSLACGEARDPVPAPADQTQAPTDEAPALGGATTMKVEQSPIVTEIHAGSAISSPTPVAVGEADFSNLITARPAGQPIGQSMAALSTLLAFRANKANGDPLSKGTGSNCDPMIAAGRSYVIAMCSQNIAFLNKSGTVIGDTTTERFFSPLAAALPCGWKFDSRLLYDDYRNRFWVTATVNPSTPLYYPELCHCGNGHQCSPAGSRPKHFIAVSQTEDPTKGWFYYWWDATAPNCTSGCNPVRDPTDTADFPLLGISKNRFWITNLVFGKQGYSFVQHGDADLAAAGRGLPGWMWWDLSDSAGLLTADNVVVPLKHHAQVVGDAYLFSHQIRGNTHKVNTWYAHDPKNDPGRLTRQEWTTGYDWEPPIGARQPGSSLTLYPVGSEFSTGVYISGRILVAGNSSRVYWPGGIRYDTVHFVQFHLDASYLIDGQYGAAGYDFLFPGVDMAYRGGGSTYPGDAAVVFNVTGPTLYPEIRFFRIDSTGAVSYDWRILTGHGSMQDTRRWRQPAPWSDLASASWDPVDDGTFWLANQYCDADDAYQLGIGQVKPR